MWCELFVVPNNPLYPNGVLMTPSVPGQNFSPVGVAGRGGGVTGASVSSHPHLPATQIPILPSMSGMPVQKADMKIPMNCFSMPKVMLNHKMDTSGHFHVFVGDLSPEVESSQLRETFSAFGIVTECKIIKDMHTQKPKGYGFIAYATKEEAEEAIVKMNGRMVGSRAIRTNWAVRRPPQAPGKDQKPLNYDEVNVASSSSNCTVYVGGITKEDLIKKSFGQFGEILEIRLFKEKGYAFVRFDSHEAATKSIITMHGKDVGSQPCKVSWGKECSDHSIQKDQTSPSLLSLYNCFANNPLALAYQSLHSYRPGSHSALPGANHLHTPAASSFVGPASGNVFLSTNPPQQVFL